MDAPFTIWKFSLRSGSWNKCKDMHCPRSSFASGSLGGGIAIVAGGMDMDANILASAELYDSSTGSWEMLPDMHTPREDCFGFFMDSKFYVLGGNSNDETLTCGEEFDLKTKTWRKIEGMHPNLNPTVMFDPFLDDNNEPRTNEYRSFVVVNNELYTNEIESFVVKKYDKENNTWEEIGRLPPTVDKSNVWGISFKGCVDQLLVFSKEPGYSAGDDIVVNSCCPKGGNLDWKVIASKVKFDVYPYGSTVMRR